MHDIFLSYARENREQVRPLVGALERHSWKVWWDETIRHGQDFSQVIEEALDASRCVVVVWTGQSVGSYWGRVESREGLRRNVLIPIQWEADLRIPLEFRGIQTANLVGWQGDTAHPVYVALIESVTALIGASEQPAPEPVRTDPPVEERSPDASRWTNTFGMEFALIPAGTFQMGAADGFDDERLVHAVRISHSFYLGMPPVTQAQWEAVMGDNPSGFKGDTNCPVESVSWEDVQRFMFKLEEREPGVRYRLPTEAEWEYAARAGTTTAYGFGDDASQLGEYAWYNANSGLKTRPVGQLKANGWRLRDMHGNVWEWVQDRYGNYNSATADDPAVDPSGPAAGADRVVRGGSWVDLARSCRSSDRGGRGPGYRSPRVGFRVLRLV